MSLYVSVAVFRRIRCTSDDCALQVGVALHRDVEATRTRLNPRLLVHAGIIPIRVALLGIEARAPTAHHANAESAARTRLMRRAHRRILHACDVQIAADIGNHLIGVDTGADDIGIAPTENRRRIARVDMRIVLQGGIRVTVAMRVLHRRRNPPPVRAKRHPHARAR